VDIDSGVSIAGIQPELVLALGIADKIYSQFGQGLVVTSVLDGQHMRGSLHYVGAAADLRLPLLDVGPILDLLRGALADNYDVVIEPGHFHIEFQPKTGA